MGISFRTFSLLGGFHPLQLENASHGRNTHTQTHTHALKETFLPAEGGIEKWLKQRRTLSRQGRATRLSSRPKSSTKQKKKKEDSMFTAARCKSAQRQVNVQR